MDDTTIFGNLIKTQSLAELAALYDQMRAGKNPAGFANPGSALKTLGQYLATAVGGTYRGPSTPPTIGSPPGPVSKPDSAPGGAVGLPLAPAPRAIPAGPTFPGAKGIYPGGTPTPTPPGIGSGGPIGVPIAPPPRPRPTPAGAVPDMVTVVLVNDP